MDKGRSASEKTVNPTLTTIVKVSGADCSDEVVAIKKALEKPGVSHVEINLMSSLVTVVHNSKLPKSKIISLIESGGVKVVQEEGLSFYSENKPRVQIVATAGIFLALAFLLSWMSWLRGISLAFLFFLPTVLAGWLVFPKALRAVRQRTLDMNVLMSAAVVGAFIIGEYAEGAAVVFLFSLAELLESFSVSRARQAIRSVLKLVPQKAHVKRNGSFETVSVDLIKVGDIIQVLPGENVPVDAQVIEGTSAVNQAPLTGESKPVAKNQGDSVFASTTNGDGTLIAKTTQDFKDSKISRVLELIEKAQEKKAPTEQFVDRFAKIYTPLVFVIALLVVAVPPLFFQQAFDLWFYRGLVLLVIACPCALVISTPVSIVCGLASMARRGVLVKGGKFLEILAKVDAIAMDKTGTLTEGKFQVKELYLTGFVSEKEVLDLSLSIEKMSSHPLARAIVEYSASKGAKEMAVGSSRNIPGKGVEVTVESKKYFIGNHRLAHAVGACSTETEAKLEKIKENGDSVVVLGKISSPQEPGAVLGIFSLGDIVRLNAKSSIEHLHSIGVREVVVLSGDNQQTVDIVAKNVGLNSAIGELLPEGKVEKINEMNLKFSAVAMVGDGVNDAPAMASAALGISMGAIGTDAAIETSDVALMRDDLSELPNAILHGRRALFTIRFNIIFSVVTKAVFLVLAIGGVANLWLAVAADMGASLLVTANALRLLRR